MTNYDRIKSMNIEEMAEFIIGKRDCQLCMRVIKHLYSSKDGTCKTGVIEWLESDAEDEE